MNAKHVIEHHFAGTSFLVKGKTYPSPLPPNLEEWYCYTSDGGHSVLCLLEGLIEPGELQPQLCPVPVRTVLRGWRVQDAYVVATTGFRYDEDFGLVTAEDDTEF